MNGLRHVPRAPLAAHVDCLWAYEGYGRGYARERVLPSGGTEIVFVLDDARARPVVSGVHSESFVIDIARRPTLLGVHFKPGGAVPFLNVPADELLNQHVALDALWGRLASEVEDRLHEAKTWAARFRVVETALLARLTKPPAPHPAVTFAVNAIQAAPHAATIGRLTERIGLSPRRFIEVFTGSVGLTPKVFARVRRFQRVLTLIDRREDVDWADVAVAGGYYDQAHFIHDFRAFSGINPTAYVRADVREPDHVPLED